VCPELDGFGPVRSTKGASKKVSAASRMTSRKTEAEGAVRWI
jgi:hypothetical protein